jgi:hypothetical protein
VRQFKQGTPWGDAVDVLVQIAEEEFPSAYVIEKAAPEKRYTLGPIYSPGVVDAHGEFSTADDLQEALHDFIEGPRELRKQHTRECIGTVKELMQWPFEHEAKLSLPGRLAKSITLPAGTVYAGVVWEPEAWPLVKAGQITGFSMGGTAVRIRNAAEDADLMKFS